MRLAHRQDWPATWNLEASIPVIAASRSASSNTMNGAWPPSSSDTRCRRSADDRTSSLPTSVEPVKVTFATRSSLEQGAGHASGDAAVTRLTTPGGKPAASIASNRRTADSGVCSAGLTTMVQPAARAGASLRAIMASGKFHGVIATATPTGWRSTWRCLPGSGDGITRPYGAATLLREPVEPLGGVAHLELGLPERLTLLGDDGGGDVVEPVEKLGRQGAQQHAAPHAALCCPRRERARSGGHRGGRVSGRGIGGVADDAAVARVVDGERRRARLPAASDVAARAHSDCTKTLRHRSGVPGWGLFLSR